MNLHLTAHHLEITPAIRDYSNEKFDKIKRHFDNVVIDVNVILSVEKLKQKAVATMHVKIIPSNQTTSPDKIVSPVETSEHSDIEVDSLTIALTPALAQSVEAVRDKLIASGISEKDVADACAWARRPKE